MHLLLDIWRRRCYLLWNSQDTIDATYKSQTKRTGLLCLLIRTIRSKDCPVAYVSTFEWIKCATSALDLFPLYVIKLCIVKLTYCHNWMSQLTDSQLKHSKYLYKLLKMFGTKRGEIQVNPIHFYCKNKK